MTDLEAQLKAAAEGGARTKLIATDGVFSMDGTIAPLPDICRLAKKYGAVVFVDDCHATGVIGEHGRGTEEYWGMQGQVDIVNSTLGKALGGATGNAGCRGRGHPSKRPTHPQFPKDFGLLNTFLDKPNPSSAKSAWKFKIYIGKH